MPTATKKHPVLPVMTGTIYITDNGAALCGAHLGYTAKVTGNDLSGQPILPVTKEMAAHSAAEGWKIKCETCGTEPRFS
jgi:hypothetical protein